MEAVVMTSIAGELREQEYRKSKSLEEKRKGGRKILKFAVMHKVFTKESRCNIVENKYMKT